MNQQTKAVGHDVPGKSSERLQDVAVRLNAMRQERDRHFARDLVGGPGWDLLVALRAGSSSSEAGPLSAATRDRWLRVLAEHGLVRRSSDLSGDAALTDDGHARMDAYLSTCIAQNLI